MGIHPNPGPWRAVGAEGMQDRTGDEVMWLHQILPSCRKGIL